MKLRVVPGPPSLVLLVPLVLSVSSHAQDLPRGAQRMRFPRDAFSPPQPQVNHLTYYGGPVVSNVVVVEVNWGAVDATVSSNMPLFYADIVDSPYIDWLCEYNTNVTSYMGTTTSNQATGRGSFGGVYTIAPSIMTSSISVDQIGTELAAQIDSSVLPEPVLDAAGHCNTVYTFHFPQGTTITYSGSVSCVQFCASHFTKMRNGVAIPFTMIPYQGPGSSCAGGCGASPTYLSNLTSVSSHELVEAINDPAIGLANLSGPPAAPIAWYDSTNGEIGDICNAQQASIVIGAHTWTVQKEWSNRLNACTVTGSATCPCVAAAPQPTTSCLGGVATFDVTASGTGVTYQWRHAGTPLVDDGVHVMGALTSSLVISDLVAGDAGSYDVVVGAGGCGTAVTTNAVALTLNPDGTSPDVVPPADDVFTQTECQ